MLFERRFIPGLAINSYVIGDEQSKRAVVIDPVRDVAPYIELAKGYTITDIVETHVHADFVSGSVELKAILDGKPAIHCSEMGGEKWTPHYADHRVKDGDQIKLGDELLLEALYTPGHTPEHLAWKLYELPRSSSVPCILFTGDFLFVGDVGRPDLLGEEAKKELAHELYQSTFERLKALPDFVEVFPAHGAGSLCGKSLSNQPNSTIGYERELNPALQQLPEREWIQNLMNAMPKAPPYFPRMKQINVHGPNLIGSSKTWNKALDAKRVKQLQSEGSVILDLRSKEAFAAAHIPGAINIPLSPMLSSFAGWVLNDKDSYILVGDGNFEDAAVQLQRIGVDSIVGHLEQGMNQWEQQGFPIANLKTVTVDELFALDKPNIIDVRTDNEWLSGHISGALHHPMGPIDPDQLTSLSKEEPVHLVCGGGTRSAIMASQLKRLGYHNVYNVLGGMSAWKQTGHPVV